MPLPNSYCAWPEMRRISRYMPMWSRLGACASSGSFSELLTNALTSALGAPADASSGLASEVFDETMLRSPRSLMHGMPEQKYGSDTANVRGVPSLLRPL